MREAIKYWLIVNINIYKYIILINCGASLAFNKKKIDTYVN